MNRTYLLSTAAATLLAAGLVAGPAYADVTVLAFITKTKTVTVIETIDIEKDVTVIVNTGTLLLTGVAEADAIKNVVTTGNTVTGLDVPPDTVLDSKLRAVALLSDALNNATGVTGFNQTAGNMVNQGNVVAVAAIANSPFAFIDTQAEADEVNTNNTVTNNGALTIGGVPITPAQLLLANLPALVDVHRSATIINAINTNTGIVDVNQDVGNMNIQNNADAIGIALGGVLALSEGALGQLNSGNTVTETETVKASTITNAINTNTGIVKVNQSAGNMNNQANNVAFSALTATAAITTPTF